MSPRRMDISSLLRDPSPVDGPPPRPRTIDALLHHTQPPEQGPASLFSILNSPSRPSFPDSPAYPSSPPFPTSHHPPRPPFLGLDALVHVASEERRRIACDSERDPHLDRERFVERDRPVHDRDQHYNHAYSPYRPASPHKRALDIRPRSPSPHPSFPSPSTRHHPSASPINNYPTLRRQSILHMEPPRSTVPNDARAIAHSPPASHRHASPFLHSPHPHQLPTHSSPRNSSPQRHSPQHLRPQHHSSPIHSGALMPETNAMSPRSGYGPRMAGGIDVFFNDPFSRDYPRSNCQAPAPTERFAPESHTEHARHDPPKLSPLPGHAFSLDEDRHQARALLYQVEAQEGVLLRERAQSRPLHSPSANTTLDNGKSVRIPVKEADFPAQPPSDRYPIRVWEERPTVRETSRRLSPAHAPNSLSVVPEGRTWVGPGGILHCKRPAREDWAAELREDVAEDVPTRPLPTCEEPPPPPGPHLAHDLSSSSEGTSHPPPLLQAPVQLRSPVGSGLQAHLSPVTLPISPNPRAPTSPVPNLHLRNFETQSELQPDCFDTQADASTGVPLPFSDTIVTKESSLVRVESMPRVTDTDDILMANPLPRQSPELILPVLAWEPGTLGISTHSAHANVSQCSSRSPSQQPLSIPLLAKDEQDTLPEDAPIFPSARPGSLPRRFSEPEYTFEREPLASEQAMMDVDEELLSLVEDPPVRAVPTMQETQIESRLGSNEAPDGPSSVSSSQLVPKGPAKTDEKDRVSMPPPVARGKKAEKDKTTLAAGPATGSKKKKEGTSKPAAKPKQPPKPRVKPVPKPKAKNNAVDISSKSSIPKGVVNANANARSRSASVIPSAMDDVPEPEPDESDKEDDKLYCICKTRYDEDRMMIACDRCDEWFHTLCVNMPDLEIDLVDQFICPPCIQKHPHLRTTWKRRCLFGLQHENPLSPEACHKPSRGAFSKYCSDDCGIKFMRVQIAQWEQSGGTRDLLWESVKNAAKREGVVVCASTNGPNSARMMDFDRNNKPLDSTAKRRAEREVARLNARLEQVVKEREFMKRELDMVMWREKVVELASKRAGKVDECGWDQRLCFGEEEWVDFGEEVLESYEEERVKVESGDDAMPLDAASHGEWWCTGKKKCERHAGWQKLRAAEVSFDKETKDGILLKLTTREREIRKRIEDILYPPTGTLHTPFNQPNGSENPVPQIVFQNGEKKGHRSCV